MNLAVKTLVVSFGNFASSMERILVFMILSRTLSTYDYGTYQQVWLFFMLVSPVFTLGLPASILYFIPISRPDQRKTIILQTLALLEIVGILFSILTILTAPLVARQFDNPALVGYLRIFSIYPLFALPPKLINLLFIAEDKVIHSTLASLLFTIFIVTSITLPSIIGLPLVYVFYGANIGAFLAFFIITAYILYMYREQKFHLELPLMKSQIGYALPLGVAGLVAVLSQQINKAVVSSNFTADIYAIYSNGAFEIPFIGMITGSLMTVLIPVFVKELAKVKEGNAVSVWSLWNKATTKTALFMFPIAVFLFFFASDFVAMMFSDKYLASAPIFRIYLLLAILGITQYDSLFQAMGRTKFMMGASIGKLLLNIILSVIFIKWIGLAGPAWANAVTMYSWALTFIIMIGFSFKVSLFKVMPWKNLMLIFLCAAISAVVVSPVLMLSLGHLSRLLVAGVIFVAVYLVILHITRIFSIQEIFASLSFSKSSDIGNVL